MAQYYMILTVAGQAAYAQAGAGGSVNIAAAAVGDGGGVAVQPAESWTALVNEVWRGAPTLVAVQPGNDRVVVVEIHIPINAGGWYIREVGLISDAGVLLAVGNHPESYKPVSSEGVGKEVQINALIEHGNAAQTVLKINPDIVMASRTYVVQAVASHDASPTAHAGQLAGMAEHVGDLANPHQVTAVQAGAEPLGAVATHEGDPEAHPDIRALIEAIEIPLATTEAAGIARRATEAEVLAGEATTPYVCPADLMAALLAGLAGVARLGAVGAYTRQQYAVPVVLTGQSGDVQLDAEQHQDVDITATAALNMLAPLHPARGMYLTVTLRAASALAITWAAAFCPNKDVALPTAFVAGKALVLQYRCMDGANWMLIGKAEGA